MQRYRVVIMMVLFGVVPVVVALFVSLSFLEEDPPEPVQTQVEPEPVVEAQPPPPPPAPPPSTPRVLAAARALPVGTLLGEEDLRAVELQAEAVRDGEHIVIDEGADETGAGMLRGYAVREALAAGEPLTRSALAGPGQRGFLAAVLRPGTRAMTINVGQAEGYAGLIDPGDRVDVILTAALPGADTGLTVTDGEGKVLSRTIVEDVRLIAVDRRIDDGGGGEDERTEVVTATLEVSPEQDDELALGAHEGTLSLAVRSLADPAAPLASNTAVGLHGLMTPPGDVSLLRGDMVLLREEMSVLEEGVALLEEDVAAALEGGGGEAGGPVVRIFRGSDPPEEVEFSSGVVP